MAYSKSRIDREKMTIRKMMEIYCHGMHGTRNTFCSQCSALMEYAMACIDRCPLREDKPVCGKCPIHCYRLTMREQIRKVMRYAGPRMMIHHPVLAVLHYWDGLTGGRGSSGKFKKS